MKWIETTEKDKLPPLAQSVIILCKDGRRYEAERQPYSSSTINHPNGWYWWRARGGMFMVNIDEVTHWCEFPSVDAPPSDFASELGRLALDMQMKRNKITDWFTEEGKKGHLVVAEMHPEFQIYQKATDVFFTALADRKKVEDACTTQVESSSSQPNHSK